jgi:hypothetical protein
MEKTFTKLDEVKRALFGITTDMRESKIEEK